MAPGAPATCPVGFGSRKAPADVPTASVVHELPDPGRRSGSSSGSACPLGHTAQPSPVPAASVVHELPDPGGSSASSSSSACPLGHTAKPAPLPADGNACPLGHTAAKPSSDGKTPAALPADGNVCPLGHTAAKPSSDGKTPAAVQTDGLSKEREQSTIPSSTGDPFMYPSEKQFYGSAVSKGHEIDKNDMKMVIAIHNAVNEKTWQDILKFEELHKQECPTPKLIHFAGRPGDVSPKARMLGWLGRTEPFDRHDWHVDRCGTPVRYVVDFYDGKPSADHPISIHIDARPEVSVGGIMDRFRMWAGV